VKQWKGLKVGYQADELYVPEIMLGSAGLSLSDVKPVKVNFDPTLLQVGTVDAYLVFVNNEPLQLHLEGVKTNVIPAYKNGMGAFYADAMFVDQSQTSKYSSQLKTFVHLVDKGWKWAMHHPSATAGLVTKNYFTSAADGGGPKGLKQQKLEIAQFASTLSRNSAGQVDGRMTLSRWKKIIKDLSTYPGSLGGQPILQKGSVSAKSCFTNKFAPPPAK
jgi:ABC-type nitrate/sulfonate/bicarbonate transport system substrate-binding protein